MHDWNFQVQKREVCSDKKKKPNKSKVNPLCFLLNGKHIGSMMKHAYNCICLSVHLSVQIFWRWLHDLFVRHMSCVYRNKKCLSYLSLVGGCALCHLRMNVTLQNYFSEQVQEMFFVEKNVNWPRYISLWQILMLFPLSHLKQKHCFFFFLFFFRLSLQRDFLASL